MANTENSFVYDAYDGPAYHIIVVAGGAGRRFGADLPKQYTTIHGKPILRHTLDNILSWPGLKTVRVVIGEGHDDLYDNAVAGLEIMPPIHGGRERSDSVYNALKSLPNAKNEDLILIHDAARPLVSWTYVRDLLTTLNTTHRAATLAAPVSQTLRRDINNEAKEMVDRNNLWTIQTPQGFRYGDILRAHENTTPKHKFTDDTGMVSALDIPVKLIKSSPKNIKITTQEDLLMATALLKNQIPDIRTGMGFDVHAFDKNTPDRPLILCGVTIDHPWALAGHSDADVALHAITDALLGAIGEKDIGHHFPPSDNTFKDMDSRIFLKKAVDMLQDKNGTLLNVDVTIICQEPKIGPHRDAMVEVLGETLAIEGSRVNVKATTTEKLGFTGRKEGIAAQAVVTVAL